MVSPPHSLSHVFIERQPLSSLTVPGGDPFVQPERTLRRNKAAVILADHQELLAKLEMIENVG